MTLNADPSRAVELMEHERTRRRFALKGIPLITLTEHALGLGETMVSRAVGSATTNRPSGKTAAGGMRHGEAYQEVGAAA